MGPAVNETKRQGNIIYVLKALCASHKSITYQTNSDKNFELWLETLTPNYVIE